MVNQLKNVKAMILPSISAETESPNSPCAFPIYLFHSQNRRCESVSLTFYFELRTTFSVQQDWGTEILLSSYIVSFAWFSFFSRKEFSLVLDSRNGEHFTAMYLITDWFILCRLSKLSQTVGFFKKIAWIIFPKNNK